MTSPPMFKVALRMAHDSSWLNRRRWSNTFYVTAPNVTAAAAAIAAAWVDGLRNAASTTVFAYEAYATDATPGTEVYDTVAIGPSNQRGLFDATGRGDQYLNKACVAVELKVPASRPSRKFWRAGLYEADVLSGDTLATDRVTTIRTAFDTFIADMSGNLVDPDGQVITTTGKIRLTTREFGREAGADVPAPPALG